MKLDITSIIKDNGGSLNIHQKEILKDLDSDLGTISFTSPVEFTGTVTNNNGMLMLRGTARMQYSTVCDRCGEKLEREFILPVDEDIIERAESDEKDDESLEDDRFTFSGNMLDLDRILADCLIPSLPMSHLCKEDCPGLCPLCGAKMQGDGCDCENSGPVDSRFEALKGFFD